MTHLTANELSEYLASELNDIDHTRINTHLEDCADCRTKMHLLEQMQSVFAATPEPVNSKDFNQRVLSGIATPKAKAFRLFNLSPQFSFEPVLQSCSFALALLLLAILPERTLDTAIDVDQLLVSDFGDEASSLIFDEDLSNIEIVDLDLEVLP